MLPHKHLPNARLPAVLLLVLPLTLLAQDRRPALPSDGPFARKNLIAWCIVPFDDRDRTPRQRAEMLNRLGIKKLAYDYRARHVPSFEEEIIELKRHEIELFAWWFPGSLNDEARLILRLLKKHDVRCQLWITGGGAPTKTREEQAERIAAECRRIRPIAAAAAKIGCEVGLYNHGGWFGEPENQLAIIEKLNAPNVGVVYNLHHAHHQLDRLPEILKTIKPHLLCLNLNGMDQAADKQRRKILTIGTGTQDEQIIRQILASGYHGPIGILNHTQRDAEAQLQANMNGLAQVVSRLDNKATPHQPPTPRNFDAKVARTLALASSTRGTATRGAQVFADPKLACLSCHRVGLHGGTIGPELTAIAKTRKPEELVASVLWPQHQVETKYEQLTIATSGGRVITGAAIEQSDDHIVLVQHTADGLKKITVKQDDIEQTKSGGSVMPGQLMDQLAPQDRLDLFAFLFELDSAEAVQRPAIAAALQAAQPHSIATFEYERKPLHPEWFPSWQQPVNRLRVYDFYSKQAAFFRSASPHPHMTTEFPGLEAGEGGHWGTQNETTWRDGRWNDTDLGTLLSGVFRGGGKVVPRSVCVRLGETGELSACFDPDTLTYAVVWQGGFLKFSDVRHGFLAGLLLDGKVVDVKQEASPDQPFRYRGFYRHGKRVVFAYEVDGTLFLDAPWVENGRFTRHVAPADQHPMKSVLRGGLAQWPTTIETKITYGTQQPFAVDTIELPSDNPWKALMFIGDHAFAPDGSAYVCTMTGDVWHVVNFQSAAGKQPTRAIWRRFASGLHQALGIVVDSDGIFVLGRDQITRLHDLNGDGEADWYEPFSRAFETSVGGHDFICGLERDQAGNFYVASGNQGIVRIDATGQVATVLATGFRNPDGLGIFDNRFATVPCSEGTWTPASMICAVSLSDSGSQTFDERIGGHRPPYFGYGGPKHDRAPDLPLVYLPRGLDNSSGAQVEIPHNRWPELAGNMIHTSFGSGRIFLLMVDEVNGQPQGGIVPLGGEFRSGIHRAAFHPTDGHLYVSGMDGWGTYTTDDGCFQRVRWNGRNVPLPCGFHVHEDGVVIEFTRPVDPNIAADPNRHFAQCWNYRYSGAYGSPEFSARHYGIPGHDVLAIKSAKILDDGKRLFLEIPELQPVNQLHLSLQLSDDDTTDLFLTIHALDEPFAGSETKPHKTIAAHPILTDLAMALHKKPNPWQRKLQGARTITIETGPNLSYRQREIRVRCGERLKVTLKNPDVVPHNWVLAERDKLRDVGESANRLIASPDAYIKQYIPDSPYILAHTDIVSPGQEFTIYFQAPTTPGRYPYLCTFPGHWMVMNGVMIVEDAVSRNDWPMWRHNATRSASTDAPMPQQLALRWKRGLPPPIPAYRNPRLQFDRGYEPVVAGNHLVVASPLNDRVTAYDTSNGRERWRFYAGGPVRFAPVIDRGRVFFGSDDGKVYALSLNDGKLIWRKQMVPSSRKVLGNRRLISVWPVRGGPVIQNNTLYLAAGVWPFEGIFVFALNADDGDTKWVNDSTGQIYSPQPHDTHALSGLTPQGYLLIDGDELIVPCGAGTPARFDRHTGKLLHFQLPTEGRLPSGWFAANDPARRGLTTPDSTIAKDRHEGGWKIPETSAGTARKIVAAGRTIEFDKLPVDVAGTIHSVLVANGKLFVTTTDGSIYCFGSPNAKPREYSEKTASLKQPATDEPNSPASLWRRRIDQLKLHGGYAVIWEDPDGVLVDTLTRESRLTVLSVLSVVEQQQDLARLRRLWDDRGLYGRRVTLTASSRPTQLWLPRYLASLIVVADPNAEFLDDDRELRTLCDSLRPYGGTLFLRHTKQRAKQLAQLVKTPSLRLENCHISREGEWIMLRRVGALPGSTNYSGSWRSADELVRFPLGLLWYDDSLSLFKRAPQPWIIDGVMVSRDKKWLGWPQGDRPPYELSNPNYTDIYTGRFLSEEEVAEFRRHWSPGDELSKRSDQYRPEGDTPWKPEQPIVGKRVNPLNGIEEPRHIRRFYGCDGGINYGHLYTMRSGTGAFYDLGIESGTVHVGGIRSGCTNNLIPAGGILNIPMMSAGCTCSYPLLTGLAMAPMPESYEQWAVWGESTTPVKGIVRMGLNLGAPGDRMTRSGTLWLDYPNRGGPSPKVSVNVHGTGDKPTYYYRHSIWMKPGKGWPWIAASGVEGASKIVVGDLKPGRFTIKLTFAEPNEQAAKGDRVFSVTLQGNTMLPQFDIVQAAGRPMSGVVREFHIETNDGRVVIELAAIRGKTLLSGIELLRKE